MRETATYTETTSRVVISTITASPTKILGGVANNGEVFLFAASTATVPAIGAGLPDRVLINSDSSPFSTSASTGTAGIPLNQWIYFGWYSGTLYAVTTSTNPVYLDVLRTR